MFNSGLKKECLNELKYAKKVLDERIVEVERFSVDLHKFREKNVELIKGNSRDKENSEHIVDLLKSFISFLQRSETDKQKLLDVVDC